MDEEKKERFPKLAAFFILFFSLILIVIHAKNPEWVDNITLFLMVIGISPYLTLFFTKIKIGDIEARSVRSAGRSQGLTTKLPSPIESQPIEPSRNLSPEAKKILATLWKYQKQTFKDDNSKRWTFRLFPNAQHYATYLAAISELLKIGLISLDFEKEYCMLTNEGMSFVDNNSELTTYTDIYKF